MSAADVITIVPGRPMVLGDVRRWVALMDAAGASDAAPVLSSSDAGGDSGQFGTWPDGLLMMTGIGGLPRSGYGPLPLPGRRDRTPIDPEPPG